MPYLHIVIVREFPPVGDLGVSYLSRAVAIVIVVATYDVPRHLQRAGSEHILQRGEGGGMKLLFSSLYT